MKIKSSLVLCGLPFSGKTTFGKRVADSLGAPFVDTDRLIEGHYEAIVGRRLSCREIYLQEGTVPFRQLESQVIVTLATTAVLPCVIALGGGALVTTANVDILRSLGTLVYLKAPLKVLVLRMLRQESLPAYLETRDPIAAFKQLAQIRQPYYENAAHVTIDTSTFADAALTAELCRLGAVNGMNALSSVVHVCQRQH